MYETRENRGKRSVTFSSSLEDDVWHGQAGASAFESWHFDALSDDGREALIIKFHDNYRFSPRYLRQSKTVDRCPAIRCPAVSLTYSVDGKIILRTVNEYSHDEFSAQKEGVGCTIGASSFHVEFAEYGSGFVVQIDLLTAGHRRILAEIEWLSVEADLLISPDDAETAEFKWNMVAPRSDVSGRIELIERRGKTRKMIHFRGSGYHDHLRSERPASEILGARCWGRAHFTDQTVIFQHIDEHAGTNSSNIFLIHDGVINERETRSEVQNITRDRYGFKAPSRLSFLSDDGIKLRVKPMQSIQAGFFESKMISEMTLMLGDGKPRKTMGITEFANTVRMRNPLFRAISDLRVGRNGRSPIF